jgi:hypothetical protein
MEQASHRVKERVIMGQSFRDMLVAEYGEAVVAASEKKIIKIAARKPVRKASKKV